MDPITSPTAPAIFAAQTAAPIHPDTLSTSTAADGTPSLTTGQPIPSSTELKNPKLGNALDDTSAAHRQSAAAPSANFSSSAGNATTGITSSNNNSNTTSSSVSQMAANAKDSIASSTPTVTGLRQRVNSIGSQAKDAANQAADHPAVKNAKGTAIKQVDQLREVLGRSPLIVHAEQRTGVDRVALAAGGIAA